MDMNFLGIYFIFCFIDSNSFWVKKEKEERSNFLDLLFNMYFLNKKN